ncbi:MAG: hypothetical protein OXJ90_14600 [Spirochaetaceae bacterium]|nr:hypothetical protein [Spirochaetaceae bacterium]
MGETAMALADTDLERIGAYVKGNLYGWFVEVAPHLVIGPQILERIATIEQELKDQRDLMAVRFDAMDRRFEEMGKRSDERFAEMGKRSDERFAAVHVRFEDMNKRFDDVNKRFEDMNKRFGSMQWLVGGAFVVIGVLMTVFEFIT